MKIFASLLVWLALALPALAAPQCQQNFTTAYLVAQDTTPGTTVWNVATGLMVANTDAGYLNWLTSIMPCPVAAISNAASNAGAIQLTVGSTASMTTGQRWQVYGTGTAADGTWPVVIDSATQITLTGSTFTGAFTTGSVYGPTVLPTQAAINAAVNQYNSNAWNVTSVSSITSAVDVTLTNPLPSFIYVNMTAAGKKLILPPMNSPGAPPIGKQFVINAQATSNIFDVYQSDGTTLLLFQVNPNDILDLVPLSNATAIGTIQLSSRTIGAPVRAAVGGTGFSVYNVGDLLYANAPTTLAKLLDVATGNALISGGADTAPSWGKVGLTTHITGTLAVGNGGTGRTTVKPPTFQVFSSGTDQTYTTPAGATAIEIEEVGGGGGGAGSGTAPGAATNGGATCWNTSGTACTTPVYQAGGGLLGSTAGATPVAGGTVTGTGTCSDPQPGGQGGASSISGAGVSQHGGMGGVSRYGGAGQAGWGGSNNATAAATNSGSGGGGSGVNATANGGGGGGAGAYCRTIIAAPAGTYTYTVGAAGAAGTAGTGGNAGAAGAAGKIVVREYYN